MITAIRYDLLTKRGAVSIAQQALSAPADITGGASYDADAQTLSWSGPLAIGESKTVTYTVTVNDPDTGDLSLDNTVVTPPGEANCDTDSTDPACRANVLVQTFQVAKVADRTDAGAGDTITYTITVTNTGRVDYTGDDPASFTDDLTGVLDDAAYNNDATGGATYSRPVLSWSGALAVGKSLTVTYSVTVNSSKTGDGQLLNVVTTPDVLSANCSTDSSDPQCRTATPVTFPTPQLPNTGVDTQGPLTLAAWLFLVGGLLLWVGYRRRRRTA